MSGVPLTDPRRAQALRAALAQMAPWLTPEWGGWGQEGDFGAALYGIAARLAEHSTRRLDQSALRDKLAFLDTLDIPAPAPRAATVPIVFMLAEKRAEPVYAPPRVQIAAAGDDQPVIFETREAIAISPARPLRLIAADPGADRIELAVPNVIAAPQPSLPPVVYRLVSAAEPGGTMLQLAQAVGLAAGDLLRIAGTAYRIAKRSGEIVTLLDPLEAPAAAGAAVEKVTRLDSFTLRNLSEHLLYVGHKELLKLDGHATIALRFDPPGLVRRLARLDIAYDLWGKHEDSVGWQPLRLLGGRDGELRLRKDWEGAVEEVEAEGRKSRWLRLRLLTPIADAAPPDTRAASLALKVNSNASAAAQPEGSSSIVSAFHNGLPLPLTTAFLPFGPEPQRFDIFAIAAPEALSKKGAAVELEVVLSDASLGSLAATSGAADRIYGIGRNGRLQAIRFDGTGAARWRQLDRPPAAASGSGGGASPHLDWGSAFYAFQSQAGPPANDVVVVRDDSKALRMAAVRSDQQDWSVAKWTILPPPGDAPPDGFCVVYTRVESPPVISPVPGPFGQTLWISTPGPAQPPVARLVVAGASGLHVQTLDPAGNTPQPWLPLTPGTGPAPAAPLLLAPVADGDGLFVAVDSAGAVFRGRIAGSIVEWTALKADDPARAGLQPAAVLHHGKTHVVLATAASTRPIAMLREGDDPLYPPSAPLAAAGTPVSITCLPARAEGPDFPLIAVTGTREVMIWSDEARAVAVPSPAKGDTTKTSSLLAVIGSGATRLLLGSANERLLHTPIESDKSTLPFSAYDVTRVDAGSSPKYWLKEGQEATSVIDTDPVEFAGGTLLPFPPGRLSLNDRYFLLSAVPNASGTGQPVADKPRRIELDAADTDTHAGDFLEIGNALFEIDSLDSTSGVAILTEDVPSGALDYAAYRKGIRRRVVATDLGTLLSFRGAALPPDLATLEFADPAEPDVQSCILPLAQPAGQSWARVSSAWSTAPTTAQATFAVPRSIGSWTQVPLPRSSENPELSWEYFDGRGWRRLDLDFIDRTGNLATSGSIHFTVPNDLAAADVAGKQDYWIRARLIGGDYGRASYVLDTSVPNRQSISVDRSALNPPEIITIEARYELQSYVAPQSVLTVNNLAAIDQTQAAAAAGAEFDLFEGLAAHTGDPAGLGRSIYLGLTRAPDVDPLSLYIDAADVGAPALRLQAEVLRPEGWAPIVCEDGTAGLARPGLLRLFLSTAPAHLPLFGCAAWWVRLRPMAPASAWAPIVHGLYLNAVTAEQARSLRQEILGSSLGEPDQSYTLAEAPVLPETLELRVRESLSDEEKAALTATDPDAVAAFADIEGEWIRWCATDSFVDQDGGARVFRLDPSSGEIRFGNGRDGKIPPAGRDSIRAVGYQAGGGSRGNVPAFAVDQLKTALESVELAINPVDAGGGADAPPKQRLAETAPARLRHATRALAPPDIEALATGSSPDVVRARCLRGRGCGIDLVVAIRKAGDRCPVPSRARREGIARNIAAVGWGALTPEAIRVRPPSYVHIRVEAVVIALSADSVAQVENDVRKAIVGFLHPVDGGPGDLGWPFGRRPWPSDVQRVASAVAGVDRVVDVVIAARDPGADLDRLADDALICAEEDDIGLVVQPPRGAR